METTFNNITLNSSQFPITHYDITGSWDPIVSPSSTFGIGNIQTQNANVGATYANTTQLKISVLTSQGYNMISALVEMLGYCTSTFTLQSINDPTDYAIYSLPLNPIVGGTSVAGGGSADTVGFNNISLQTVGPGETGMNPLSSYTIFCTNSGVVTGSIATSFNNASSNTATYEPVIGSFASYLYPDVSVNTGVPSLAAYTGSIVLELPIINAFGENNTANNWYNTNVLTSESDTLAGQTWLYNCLEIKGIVRPMGVANNYATSISKAFITSNIFHFSPTTTSLPNLNENTLLSGAATTEQEYNTNSPYYKEYIGAGNNLTSPTSFTINSTTPGFDSNGNAKNTFRVYFNPSNYTLFFRLYLANPLNLSGIVGAYIKGTYTLF